MKLTFCNIFDADIISETVYLLGLYVPGLTIAILGSAGPADLGSISTLLKTNILFYSNPITDKKEYEI